MEPRDFETRQIKTLLYVKEHESISNAQYQELTSVSKRTATRDFQVLIEKGFIQKFGTTGKGTTYVFKQDMHRGHKGAKGAT